MIRALVLATALLAVAAPAEAMATRPAAGPTPAVEAAVEKTHYQGELQAGPQRLAVGVTIGRLADGSWVGGLDVPAQGAKGIPLTNIVSDGSTLSFDIPTIGAAFAGTVKNGEVVGQWKQGGANLPLTLKAGAAPVAISRPQTPKPPFPYRAEEVSYTNPQAGNRLAGTLTLPEGQGPFPAVLLITGSGAQDRDETILGHKPFLLIADALTRRGVAVLRVDDRGVGGSTGDVHGTSLDFVTDVEAGLAFLKRHPAIDKGEIGLLGHSEGGLIAPIVAAKHPQDVDFVVLLAAAATPGGDVIMDQIRAIARVTSKPQAELEAQLAAQARLYEILRTQKGEQALASLRTLLGEQANTPEAKQQVEAQLQAINGPWFRTFIDLDPRPYLAQLKVPVLALTGGKDINVNADKHLPALKSALKQSPEVTTKLFPGLNHLFQPAKTGMPSEYGEIETTMEPQVLEVLADWVVKQTKK